MLLKRFNIALLTLWSVFLFWLLTYGSSDLIRLLHPRLWWVLFIAAVVLIIFLVSLIIEQRRTATNKLFLLELPGLLILTIPFLYFFIAKDARLDATSLQNRIIQDDTGLYINNLPTVEIFGTSDSEEMLFSKIIRKPTKYENEEVEVVCQSFVNEQLPDNTAMCYRYMITCCAADALPAFIFLNHNEELEIENNQWIKVNGPLSVINNNNMVFPSVKIDAVEYVEEPAFPWAM